MRPIADRRSLLACLLLGVLWLAGCATTPYEGEGKDRSDALLRAQLLEAERAAPEPAGRVIFAGFAMHSQSKAFRGDVLTAEAWVRKIDPAAVVFRLDNPVLGQSADWPYATAENAAVVLNKVAELARPQDKVVLLFSTHGNRDVLSINFANQYYPALNGAWLVRQLAALGRTPTVLLLSACHSGSFIPTLRAPSRVILAAAAADRSSFGCNFGSRNTFFIDALLNQERSDEKTLVELMDAAKADIDGRERAMGLAPPAQPQGFYGPMAQSWARQPVRA
ncbi:MAG: C13 family peptidase, partial [Burkholderiales bacterium]